MDDAMGNITAALKSKQMWNDSLIVFRCPRPPSTFAAITLLFPTHHSAFPRLPTTTLSADNGGWPSQSGDNSPLIGGKVGLCMVYSVNSTQVLNKDIILVALAVVTTEP